MTSPRKKGACSSDKLADVFGEAVGERHDDGEDHGGGADHGGADQHRLGRGLEGVARPVALFQHVLGAVEVRLKAEIFLDFFLDVGNLLDQREFIHRLGVVRDGAVRIHGNGYRSHPQEAESHQAESKDRRGQHQAAESHVADDETDGHQEHHGQAQVISGEISRHETGKNAQ